MNMAWTSRGHRSRRTRRKNCYAQIGLSAQMQAFKSYPPKMNLFVKRRMPALMLALVDMDYIPSDEGGPALMTKTKG